MINLVLFRFAILVHDDTDGTDVVHYLVPVHDDTDVVHYLVPDTRRCTLSFPCTWWYKTLHIIFSPLFMMIQTLYTILPLYMIIQTLCAILSLYMMIQDVVHYLAPVHDDTDVVHYLVPVHDDTRRCNLASVHDDTKLCTLSCPRTWWYKTLYTILSLYMMIQDFVHYLVPVHDDTRLFTLSCPCTWWYKTLYTILSLYMMIQEVVHYLALARCLNLVFQINWSFLHYLPPPRILL